MPSGRRMMARRTGLMLAVLLTGFSMGGLAVAPFAGQAHRWECLPFTAFLCLGILLIAFWTGRLTKG